MEPRIQTVLVLGATGRVGSIIVDMLAHKNYEVRAFVHGEPRERIERVTYLRGDVADSASLERALEDVDVVVSALGSWGTKDKNTLTVAMRNIIPLLEQKGIKRIVSLTGADASAPGQELSLFQKASHLLFSMIASKILKDGEQHITILSESALDWTAVRSPVMNEKGSYEYALSEKYPMPWHTIRRGAVARSMVHLIESGDFVRQAPYLSRQ